jgi:putative membrane protein
MYLAVGGSKFGKKLKSSKGGTSMKKKFSAIINAGAFACLLLATIGLVAYAKHDSVSTASNVQNTNSSNTGMSTATRLGLGDRKFVMEAAMGGMAEVELGRVAVEKGHSDAVKQFGQRMVDDHSAANTELMNIVSGKAVKPPTALDAKHKAMMTRFSRLSGTAFDRAYARDMINDHVKDVGLFKREAASGRDADLKAFAAKTLPTLQEHLRMARELPSKIGH